MLTVEETVEVILFRSQNGAPECDLSYPFDRDPDVDLHRAVLLSQIVRPVDPDAASDEDTLILDLHTDPVTGNVSFETR